MTFEDWWDLLTKQYGKPRRAEQQRLSKTFAHTAWEAGYKEACREFLKDLPLLRIYRAKGRLGL